MSHDILYRKIFEQTERLGKSEIELVNIFIEGLAAIIKLEQKLEAGEDIETDIALVSNSCNMNHVIFYRIVLSVDLLVISRLKLC